MYFHIFLTEHFCFLRIVGTFSSLSFCNSIAVFQLKSSDRVNYVMLMAIFLLE